MKQALGKRPRRFRLAEGQLVESMSGQWVAYSRYQSLYNDWRRLKDAEATRALLEKVVANDQAQS